MYVLLTKSKIGCMQEKSEFACGKAVYFRDPVFSGRWSSCRCWVSRELFLLYDLVPCFCENSTNCLIAWRVQHQYHQAQSSIQEREDPIQVDVLKEERKRRSIWSRESRANIITPPNRNTTAKYLKYLIHNTVIEKSLSKIFFLLYPVRFSYMYCA